MGVHITFVRSLDLDEWTQRQIDGMRIGGNGNATKFFRKHGITDFHTKTDKKYTCKAAVAYRAELEKLVEAEAKKRGEGIGPGNGGGSSSLLDNADATMKKDLNDEARSKLDAARANGTGRSSAGVMQPSAKLASQMSGAKGRLAMGASTVTPSTNGRLSTKGFKTSAGPKLVLRKPASSSASTRLMKKSSALGTASRIRVNKITTPSTSSAGGDDTFEDVETTQKNLENEKKKEAEEKKRLEEEDAKLAQELQDQLNGLGDNGAANGHVDAAVPAATEEKLASSKSTMANGAVSNGLPKPKASVMVDNMKKLSDMNCDFFSGM